MSPEQKLIIWEKQELSPEKELSNAVTMKMGKNAGLLFV